MPEACVSCSRAENARLAWRVHLYWRVLALVQALCSAWSFAERCCKAELTALDVGTQLGEMGLLQLGFER